MGMNITASKGKSPYAKHGKAPFQYSDEYRSWADAVARNDTEATMTADVRFRRRFDVPMPKVSG
jgi:hypothetical protein